MKMRIRERMDYEVWRQKIVEGDRGTIGTLLEAT